MLYLYIYSILISCLFENHSSIIFLYISIETKSNDLAAKPPSLLLIWWNTQFSVGPFTRIGIREFADDMIEIVPQMPQNPPPHD